MYSILPRQLFLVVAVAYSQSAQSWDFYIAELTYVLLRVAGVTAGLAESNGSLPPGL